MVRRTAVRALDRNSPLPLWAQLQQELIRRLSSGAFDRHFPGELELAETYQVSRHTVREALRRLREEGAIDSARGRATTIRRQEVVQPLGNLYSLFREVESQGRARASKVLAQQLVTDSEAAAALNLEPDSKLFFLERVRLVDDEPLAYDRVWLPGSVATPLQRSDFTRSSLYDELASRCGVQITGGRERISAIVPSSAERDLLGAPRSVACLSIERIGQAGTTVVEFRRTVVRGDCYTMVDEWSGQGYVIGADVAPAPNSGRGRRP